MATVARPLSRFSFQTVRTIHRPRMLVSRTVPSCDRSYQSSAHPEPEPYDSTSSILLSAALARVPEHGFTETSLKLGAQDAGLLSVSTNLLPRGVYELVNYHLVTQRLALKDRVQFPPAPPAGKPPGTGAKIRALVLARLRGNADAGVVSKWQGALAVMALPQNIPPSLKELARLSDEMWFLAGDLAVDGSWYSKRASLAAVYAAAELYQTQDQSTDFRDTEMFVDSRLDEVRTAGRAVSDFGEWAGFTGRSIINVLRSKGMKI